MKRREVIRVEAPMVAGCRPVSHAPHYPGRRETICWRVAARTGYSRRVTDEICSAMFIEIMQVLCETGKVQVNGFGHWTVTRFRGATGGMNNRTGKRISVPPGWRIRFSATKRWRQVVREAYDAVNDNA